MFNGTCPYLSLRGQTKEHEESYTTWSCTRFPFAGASYQNTLLVLYQWIGKIVFVHNGEIYVLMYSVAIRVWSPTNIVSCQHCNNGAKSKVKKGSEFSSMFIKSLFIKSLGKLRWHRFYEANSINRLQLWPIKFINNPGQSCHDYFKGCPRSPYCITPYCLRPI